MMHKSAWVRVAWWILVTTLGLGATTVGIAGPDRKALLDNLRHGGYVIYFRHAQTDWSHPDRLMTESDVVSCDRKRMRQLSEKGRAKARALGEAIRRLNIPVHEVYASPYCRTVETARLLDLGPVLVTRDVLNVRAAAYAGGRDALAAAARRRLSTPPPQGANTVVVAHGNVLMLLAGHRPPEAGAAIIKPMGNGRFNLITFWSAADWLHAGSQR